MKCIILLLSVFSVIWAAQTNSQDTSIATTTSTKVSRAVSDTLRSGSDSIHKNNPVPLNHAELEKSLDPVFDFAPGADTIPKIHKDPLTAATLSLIIPGGGQFYTQHYVKSGMFFAAEAISGLIAYNRYLSGKDLKHSSDSLFRIFAQFKDSTSINWLRNKANTADSIPKDTVFWGTHYGMKYSYAKAQEQENANFVHQTMMWMAGIYYYNILDALKNTGYFSNSAKKNPSTAGWLSAIPGLGLGQFYNGELSKAGMIFMVQASLGYVVYNYHQVILDCERNLAKIMTKGTQENRDADALTLKQDWDAKRTDAFRNRNMYLWYSILFYFYGILDAVVDAHLHDAATKMKLEPDLIPNQKAVGINLKINF